MPESWAALEPPVVPPRPVPVANIADAMVFTVNEPIHTDWALALGRSTSADVLIRAWLNWGSAPDWPEMAHLPARAHAAGMLWGGGLTCSALYRGENGLTDEDLLDMATRGWDGALVDIADSRGLHHGSVSGPRYLDYLLQWLRAKIAGGADLLFMDEHDGALGPFEGYDDHSIQEFRAYLRKEHVERRGGSASDWHWATELDIEVHDPAICPDGTIASFAFRARLVQRGHLNRLTIAGHSLVSAWEKSCDERNARVWAWLTERVRLEARAHGRRVFLCGNGLAPRRTARGRFYQHRPCCRRVPWTSANRRCIAGTHWCGADGRSPVDGCPS
ncbi:MAG: hypothetical protein N2652_00535 [Kiritimatiellae bacterium]|nr:hypothetical protein [Kiritimatiellia bacterium]